MLVSVFGLLQSIVHAVSVGVNVGLVLRTARQEWLSRFLLVERDIALNIWFEAFLLITEQVAKRGTDHEVRVAIRHPS